MSPPVGGFTEFRFVYCAHQHEESEECDDRCHHDVNCRRHSAPAIAH